MTSARHQLVLRALAGVNGVCGSSAFLIDQLPTSSET
jgi:hypothetical protein